MSDHKDWATPENLYRAADNADAAGFTEYGWKLQGSAERIESLWAEIESLQRERDELKAELEPWREFVEKCERAGDIVTAKQKPPPDIFIGASAITPEMRAVLKRAFALAREVEESELAEDLCGLLIETDPYRDPT